MFMRVRRVGGFSMPVSPTRVGWADLRSIEWPMRVQRGRGWTNV